MPLGNIVFAAGLLPLNIPQEMYNEYNIEFIEKHIDTRDTA
jgi:hypothetical protein